MLKKAFLLLQIALESGWTLAFRYPRNRRFIEKKINQLLENEALKLRPADWKRLKMYVALATLSAAWLESVRSIRLSKQQTECALLYTCLTPFFDDLLDDFKYSETEMQQVLQKKQPRGLLHERICIAFCHEIERLTGQPLASPTFEKVIHFQLLSKKQSLEKLPDEELRVITFSKGGYALLLASELILRHELSPVERDATFLMGAVVQLTDDILDVFQDRSEGIQTLATNATDIRSLRKLYDATAAENRLKISQLPFSKRRIRRFLAQHSLIPAVGQLALDRLENLQKMTDDVFQIEKYARSQLVLDMAQWRNRWAFFWRVLRQA